MTKQIKNHPHVMKILLSCLLILALLKLPQLIDNRPPIYKNHEVIMFSKPLLLPADYPLYDTSNNPVTFSKLHQSKLTILVFWATWCGYCAHEFPYMDDMATELTDKNINLMPINRGDDTPDKIEQFFKRGNIQNLTSFTPKDPSLHKILGVMGYPSYVAVNEKGEAFAKLRPNWTRDDIGELFDKLKNFDSL